MRRLALLAGLIAGPALAGPDAVLEMQAGGARMALAPAEMQVILRTEGRAPEVFIKMAEALTQQFAAFTAAHIGEVVHVTVCGKEITAPVLRGKISKGTIRLAMPDMTLANTIADQLKGTVPCPANK